MTATATFAAPSRAPRAFGSALYHQTSVQTGVEGASPHGLVAMLFDGLIDAIAQARGAIATGNIELKGSAIGRAVRIVDEGLKCALDMQNGGTLAVDLSDLYAYIIQRLTMANLRSDDAALDECKRLIEPLRDAWMTIAPTAGR